MRYRLPYLPRPNERNRNDPIRVAPPKVAKAITVTWLSRVIVADGYANKRHQCKRSITDYARSIIYICNVFMKQATGRLKTSPAKMFLKKFEVKKYFSGVVASVTIEPVSILYNFSSSSSLTASANKLECLSRTSNKVFVSLTKSVLGHQRYSVCPWHFSQASLIVLCVPELFPRHCRCTTLSSFYYNISYTRTV